jgi:hypothetical protein
MPVRIDQPPAAKVPILRIEDEICRITLRCLSEGSLDIETLNKRSRSAAQVILSLDRSMVEELIVWMNKYLRGR